jgi:hypothetical protein
MKNRCDAEKSNEYYGCDFIGVVMVEKVLRSWNKPLNQGKHVEQETLGGCERLRDLWESNQAIARGFEVFEMLGRT